MKSVVIAGLCSISLSIFGCASEAGSDDASTDSDITSQLAENDVAACTATQALVGEKDGNATLVTMTKAGKLYSVGSTEGGKVTVNASTWSFKAGNAAAVDLGACKKVTGAEASSWAAAKGVATYMNDIDSLASSVTDEMSQVSNDARNSNATNQGQQPNAYVVFAIETSKRDTLDLGTKVSGTAGALPSGENNDGIDSQDWSYGGVSACYGLGGGEDWGEWFQGASDGTSLDGDVTPLLGSTKGGYIAHEKVKALDGLVDSSSPSAIELTVGGWTFLIPDSFSK